MKLVLVLLAILLVPMLGGCMAVGAVAGKVFGSDAYPARYVPVKEDSMVVVVERSARAAIPPEDADRLTLLLEDQIQLNKIAPLVDSAKLLSSADKYYGMTAAERGRVVGAKQVLRVVIEKYTTTRVIGSETMVRIQARVHVVDSASGEDRWPKSEDGTTVEASSQAGSTDSQLDSLAAKVVALFYSHD